MNQQNQKMLGGYSACGKALHDNNIVHCFFCGSLGKLHASQNMCNIVWLQALQ